jgi:hypothetical protein
MLSCSIQFQSWSGDLSVREGEILCVVSFLELFLELSHLRLTIQNFALSLYKGDGGNFSLVLPLSKKM